MSRLSRRHLLCAAAGASALPAVALEAAEVPEAQLALPGPHRGRVVEVRHPGSVTEGKVRGEAVRDMMARGMVDLTGAADEKQAWRRFFSPGDVVGIKVCPVGKPLSISQPETLLEVTRGLNLAGVPNENIVWFNRYLEEITACGFDKITPKGVTIAYGSQKYDEVQTATDGYDLTQYAEFERVMTGVDPAVAVNRRSHLSLVVTKQVTKIVNVCVLKDHASAGVTMALKNMSHGFSNNVCRSHATASINWCDTFIPGVVSLKPVRRKVVLHVGDGLIGTYDGGPGNWNPHFRTWEYGALFFATDPVAMDRVGWEILDAKRKEHRLPPLARTGRKLENPGHEGFDERQPQHVLIAGRMGLGEADLAKINHTVVRLT